MPGETPSKLRALERKPRAGHSSRIAHGADELQLAVDLERGVLLRHAALLEGSPFEVKEITEIVFDEDLDPELFQLQPPPERRRRRRRIQPRTACNFCGKPSEEVKHLVVGNPVFICNECVGISREITSVDRSED